MVEKGTYWEPNTGSKIVLKDDGFLPANRKQTYFKLPESYLLIPGLLLGLVLSIALPYGIGVALFAFVYVLYKILFCLTSECERLLGDLLAHISIGYRPGISFFSGRPRRPKYRKGKENERKG